MSVWMKNDEGFLQRRGGVEEDCERVDKERWKLLPERGSAELEGRALGVCRQYSLIHVDELEGNSEMCQR